METRVVIDSKFDFGNVVATTALYNHCKMYKFSLLPYLVRHANCDWATSANPTGKATIKP